MKLSTSLLSAIITGILMQGAVSCTKSKEDPSSKTSQAEKDRNKAPTEPCPACGMG